jgi:hypothetical protein
VACENGNRPQGVITYPATDGSQLAAGVEYVLAHRAEVVAGLSRHDVPDTVTDEVDLLTS